MRNSKSFFNKATIGTAHLQDICGCFFRSVAVQSNYIEYCWRIVLYKSLDQYGGYAMKKIKKAMAVLVAITMVITLLPLTGLAAGTEYQVGDASALNTRINALQSGDILKLTADISLTGNNYSTQFDGKTVTFDLNGHNLGIGNITIGSGGNLSVIGGVMTVSGLTANNGGVIGTASGGVLNVNGTQYGGGVTATGLGSIVTVNNVQSSSYAVTVSDGGSVTVNGNITVNTSYSGVYGVSATGNGCLATINGNITINGSIGKGVYITNAGAGTGVTVNGSIAANGYYASGVLIQNSSNAAVAVTGDVVATSNGVCINSNSSGSGNSVIVSGDVTAKANSGLGVRIIFSAGDSITVHGDVNVTGEVDESSNTAYGVAANASCNNSTITVDGSVSVTGNNAYGAASEGNGNIVSIGQNITSTLYGANVSGNGAEVHAVGSITAAGTGVSATSGGKATIDGDISLIVSGTSSYDAVYASGATVIIGGDVSINGASSVSGIKATSGSTITVTGDVTATSSVDSATGVTADGSTVTAGNITAIGAGYSVTGVSIYTNGSAVTAGMVSASGASSNYGIKASGSTMTTVKGIAAGIYITMYSPNATLNMGGGTLNSGYYDYINGSTLVKVNAWTLTVDHNTGGVAGIGGTSITTGTYEASKVLNLVANDTIPLNNFGNWTSSAGGSFSNPNSKTTSFTMPAADVTVTANFQPAVAHAVNTSGITGGTVTAVPSSAEAGDTVTLTVTPNSNTLFVAGSLKYNDGTEHALIVTGNTASFVMPDCDVTVSATFDAITLPDITTTTLPGGMETVSYSQTLTYVSNAPVDWSVSTGTLPAGLTLSAAGVISGTPTAAGTFNFTVQASNGGGSGTQALTLTITAKEPIITTATLPNATEDASYSALFTATGVGSITWSISAGSLPTGLNLNASTGELSGTVSAEISAQTNYYFTVKAHNSYGDGTQAYTLIVQPAPEYNFTIVSDANGSITAGTGGFYEAGAQITIEATPATGYLFDCWDSTAGSFWNSSSNLTTFFMPGSDVEVTAHFKFGYIVTIDTPISGGSVSASTAFTAAGDIVTLTITPDTGMQLKAGSLEYNDGTDHILTDSNGFASFTMPANDVTISAEFEEKPAIEVGSASALYSALYNLSPADVVKIKLTNSFTYNNPIYISGTKVTIDLNGYTLTVDTVGSDESALSVTNSGTVAITGTGALNVQSDYIGVYAASGSIATVTTAKGDGAMSYGVYASGGTVTVKGDATSTGANSIAVYINSNGTVTVDGKVTVAGANSRGLRLDNGSATLKSDISVSGDFSYGLYVEEDGSATVKGNISATGESAIAVYAVETDAVEILGNVQSAGVDAVGIYADNSIVKVEKAITATTAIVLYDGSDEITFNIGDGEYDDNSGYFIYSIDYVDAIVLVRGWELINKATDGGSLKVDASGIYEAGTNISISAEALAGKTFTGWTSTGGGSFVKSSDTTTTFTMPAADTIVTANFATPVPTGGGGTANSETDTTSTSGNTTTTITTVTATTGSGGTASASVTQSQIDDAARQALNEAAKQGTKAEVEINVSTMTGTTGISVTMPQAALEAIAEGGVSTLTISSAAVTVSFDETALASISQTGSGSITISAVTADDKLLTEEYKQTVGNRPVFDLTVTSGSTTISSFGGGTATVSIPYQPGPDEDLSRIVIYYISDSGALIAVPNCAFNPATGMVTFTAKHFSTYAVGYNDIRFADVSGWYAEDAYYLAVRGIMKGPGDGLFNPDGSITRVELAQILYKLAGSPAIAGRTSPFSDVKATAWYFDAVKWAYDMGVISGYDGRFDPDTPVKRQDIAVMLMRYVDNVTKNPLQMTNQATTFIDSANIASYAQGAVMTMQRAGIIRGIDGSFNPQANATRAEAAKMVASLMKAI